MANSRGPPGPLKAVSNCQGRTALVGDSGLLTVISPENSAPFVLKASETEMAAAEWVSPFAKLGGRLKSVSALGKHH